MNDLLYLFGGAVVLASVLANIGIWAPRRLWVRVSALFTAALFIPLAYASAAALLSRPKPVSLEWVRGVTQEAAVLGSSIREGEAIYVWLQMPDSPEPRAYTIPWNQDLAQQLQEARTEAESHGTGLQMRLPFEESWDTREPKFYALPQPQLPQKEPPPAAPRHVPHPSQET
jgi:hypothetical protein